MIKEKRIEINSYEDIKVLFGQQDQNKDLIEAELAVELEISDNNIIIKGFEDNVHKTGLLLEYLLIQISNSKELVLRRVEYIIEELMNQELEILF